MNLSFEPRSNRAWIDALGSGDRDGAAARDLEAFLERILRSVAGRRLPADALPDLVQESMVRIVEGLPAFRGDSAFTTWAAGIATRVAFTEVRRRQMRERRERALDEVAAGPGPSPLEAAARADLDRALEEAIATGLSERQRVAIVAELRGISGLEIAEGLGITPNAFYKLAHDARKKLRRLLFEAGFTADSLRQDKETPR